MNYKYKHLEINLFDEEVYFLWDLLKFIMDEEVVSNFLSPEKKKLCQKLIDICDEFKSV